MTHDELVQQVHAIVVIRGHRPGGEFSVTLSRSLMVRCEACASAGFVTKRGDLRGYALQTNCRGRNLPKITRKALLQLGLDEQ